VGGSAFVIDFVIYSCLIDYAGLSYLVANPISFAVGLAYTYTLNVLWVFQKRNVQNRIAEFLIFTAIALTGLGLSELLLWIQGDCLGIDKKLAKAVAAGIIWFYNFGIKRLFLFG
jgi:putative flippase GtrA